MDTVLYKNVTAIALTIKKLKKDIEKMNSSFNEETADLKNRNKITAENSKTYIEKLKLSTKSQIVEINKQIAKLNEELKKIDVNKEIIKELKPYATNEALEQAIKDLQNSINNISLKEGKQGIQGKQGLNGLDGKNGTDGKDGKDGINGKDGNDGLTPVITDVETETVSSEEYADVEIERNKDNEYKMKFKIPRGLKGFNGTRGIDGQDGQNGVGVPEGGTTGQVLKKKSDTSFDTEWVTGGGSGSSVLVLDSIEELPETATDGDMAYVKSTRIPYTPTIFELEKLYSQIYINPIPEKLTVVAPGWSGDFIIKTDKAWLMYIEQNEELPTLFAYFIGEITSDPFSEASAIYFYVWEAYEPFGITEAGWYNANEMVLTDYSDLPPLTDTTLTLSTEEFIIIEDYISDYISDNDFNGTEILGDRLYIYQNEKWTLVNEEVAKTYADLGEGITGRHAHVMENSTTSSWKTLTETILDNLPDVFEMKFEEVPTFIDGASEDYFTYISFENGAMLQFNPGLSLPEPTFIFENISNDGKIYIYTATDFDLDFGTGTLLHLVVGWNVVENFGEEDMSVNPIEYSNIPIISDTGISDIAEYAEWALFPSILVNIATTNYKGDYIFNGKTWQYEPYNVVKTNGDSNKALFGDGEYKLIPELVTYLGWGNTDEQVPSALSVFNSLQAKEDLSNKVSDLFSYDDDTHYATTNAIKNYLTNQLENYINSYDVINGYVPYNGATKAVILGNQNFKAGLNNLFNVDVINDCVAINSLTDTIYKLIVGGKAKFNGNINLNNNNINNGTDITGTNCLGSNAGYGVTNSTYATFIGSSAGYNANGSDYTVFIGALSGYSSSNNSHCVCIGYNSGVYGTNNTYCCSIGGNSGGGIGNSYSNSLGVGAGQNIYNGTENNCIGYFSGLLSNGSYNNYIGTDTAKEITGSYNNFIGYQAGKGANNTFYGIFIGYQSGIYTQKANECIFIGSYAGAYETIDNTASGTNICIGQYSGTGGYKDSIAIGHGVANSAVNELNIGNVLKATGLYASDNRSSDLLQNSKVTVAKLNIAYIPTSSSGLSSGDIWNDNGTLKIV